MVLKFVEDRWAAAHQAQKGQDTLVLGIVSYLWRNRGGLLSLSMRAKDGHLEEREEPILGMPGNAADGWLQLFVCTL